MLALELQPPPRRLSEQSRAHDAVPPALLAPSREASRCLQPMPLGEEAGLPAQALRDTQRTYHRLERSSPPVQGGRRVGDVAHFLLRGGLGKAPPVPAHGLASRRQWPRILRLIQQRSQFGTTQD